LLNYNLADTLNYGKTKLASLLNYIEFFISSWYFEKVAEKELTVKEVNSKTNLPISTISLYCRTKVFPRAHLVESPVGNYWLIPENDLQFIPNRGRGRPKNEEKDK